MLTTPCPPPIALITSMLVSTLIKMSTLIWLKNFVFASSSSTIIAASHCPNGVLMKTVSTSSPPFPRVFSISVSWILFIKRLTVRSETSFFTSLSALLCSCLMSS